MGTGTPGRVIGMRDSGTRGLGRGDACIGGRRDVGMRGRGDVRTRGHGDARTWRRGDTGTLGCGVVKIGDARSGTWGGDKQEEPFSVRL